MRLLSHPRRTAATLVAVGALLAGCGGSGTTTSTDTSPAIALAAAVENNAEAGSYRLDMTVETQVAGQSFDVTASGMFDEAERVGQLTMSMPMVGSIEQRIVGDDLYMTMPQQPGTWLHVPLADVMGSQFAVGADASQTLEALKAVSGEVEQVGSDDVGTHYRGTIDVEKAMEQVGGQLRDLLGEKVDQLQLADVPFDAWVDDEGRVVQYAQTMTIPGSDATQGQPLEFALTMKLSDFGVDVDVQPPPADQVQDGSALLGGMSGS